MHGVEIAASLSLSNLEHEIDRYFSLHAMFEYTPHGQEKIHEGQTQEH
jgi:hypothetical protein